MCIVIVDRNISTSIIGLVVEFVVAIDEARVRFTDDAQEFLFAFWLWNRLLNSIKYDRFLDDDKMSLVFTFCKSRQAVNMSGHFPR